MRRLQRDIEFGAVEYPPPQVLRYPDMLAVKTGGRYSTVAVDGIDWVEAVGNYARLHVGASSYLLNKTLTDLEKNVLDPTRFLRIHRSTIVNLSRIASVEPLFGEEYAVVLKDGTKRTCSRRHRKELRERICFIS